MNIFHLSDCPLKAARFQCNKHVVKMVTESANMLLVPFVQNYGYLNIPKTKSGRDFKATHQKHPSTVWANTSRENYYWLLDHTYALLAEYRRRYNKEHYCVRYVEFVSDWKHKLTFEIEGITPFARCFGDYKIQLESEPDTVKAYQQFYWLDKKEFARWPSIEHIPHFWPEKIIDFVDKSFNNGVYKHA